MQLRLDQQVLSFTQDADSGEISVLGRLPAWQGFACDNSREDARGEVIRIVLMPNDEGELSNAASYQAALDWVSKHQISVRDHALGAVLSYIQDTLIGEYGLDDEDLAALTSTDQLTNAVDPSFLRLFPQQKSGLPYFAFELECNWDPEHGCGVLFCGPEVVEVGGSESAQGSFDIASHADESLT